MKVLLLLVSFALLLPRSSFAWGLKELGEEAAVPWTTDAKYALMGGAALTLAFVIFEDAVVDPFQEKTARNRPLGTASVYGDLLGQMVPNIMYIGGMAIAGQYGDTKAHNRALGMFKATAYSSAVTTVLKYSLREPRPNDWHDQNSFPSGHTTTAFAFSGYITAEHGWGWGSAAILMSSFTAFSRINDNKHWIHDVTAGATIGWVYGWGISRYYKNRHEKNEATVTTVLPLFDTKTAGMALYHEF